MIAIFPSYSGLSFEFFCRIATTSKRYELEMRLYYITSVYDYRYMSETSQDEDAPTRKEDRVIASDFEVVLVGWWNVMWETYRWKNITKFKPQVLSSF